MSANFAAIGGNSCRAGLRRPRRVLELKARPESRSSARRGMRPQTGRSPKSAAEYRYFGSFDPEFERNGVKTTVEIGIHNARSGFRT